MQRGGLILSAFLVFACLMLQGCQRARPNVAQISVWQLSRGWPAGSWGVPISYHGWPFDAGRNPVWKPVAKVYRARRFMGYLMTGNGCRSMVLTAESRSGDTIYVLASSTIPIRLGISFQNPKGLASEPRLWFNVRAGEDRLLVVRRPRPVAATARNPHSASPSRKLPTASR